MRHDLSAGRPNRLLRPLIPLILAFSVSHGWATEPDELVAGPMLAEHRCDQVLRHLEQQPTGQHGTDEAVEIRVNLHVLDILAVDDTAGTFTADVLMFVSWNDPRLTDSQMYQRLRGCELEARPAREVPPLHLANGYDSSTRVPVDPSEYRETGAVSYRERIRATFGTRFDLHDFPFDRQTFDIGVISPTAAARIPSCRACDRNAPSVNWRARRDSNSRPPGS